MIDKPIIILMSIGNNVFIILIIFVTTRARVFCMRCILFKLACDNAIVE